MTSFSCDVAVLGAGTAGLAAERSARKAGARTLLIDPEFAGTTCATVGCMPSKLLIAAADAAHGVGHAAQFGISAEAIVDGARVMQRVRAMRDDFAGSVRAGIADLPDGTCLKGRATFVAPGVLSLDTGDRVEARAVVIATGGAPSIPEPFRQLGDRLLTNETVFDLKDLPDSVGVIGAGAIGVELAQALARLGVRVVLFDGSEAIAGLPEETSAVLARALSRELKLHLSTKPEAELRGQKVHLTWDGGEDDVERLVIAAGRPPNLDGLNLGAAGIRTDDDGMPSHDPETLQIADSAVFIAGDVNAARPVLHEASDEGAIAGHNAAHHPKLSRSQRQVPLTVTFCRPSAAIIGKLPDGESDLVTGYADFSDQGRARVEARNTGLLRIHADSRTGRLAGADLCMPDGEHVAHLLAWAIACELTADFALTLPFYHPTLEEGIRTALQDLCKSIRSPTPWNRDSGPLPGT